MKGFNNKVGLAVVAVLAVGAILAINVSRQSTENRQGASEIININTGEKVADSRNYDGSMGPANWYSNFSNSLAPDSVGSLIFSVTDPVQGQPSGTPPYGNALGKKLSPTPTCQPRPACLDATPPCMLPITSDMCPKSSPINSPSGGQPSVSPQAGLNGSQTVTSLILKITKVEVHLAYLGTPGSQRPNVSPQAGKPSSTPGAKPSGTPVDHWETLNVPSPTSVDLVELAKGGVTALGLTKLAAGQYTQVRLYVSNATAKLSDGTNVTLTIVGKNNIVRIVQPFTIVAGKTTSLTMDFDAQRSVVARGNGDYLLKPVVARLLETR
ncbi:MAG: DUF4382 domain-containing protein [Patescibacteria group bacterium]|nr:DUF4382 domain-containing protein [Patescibacteria group bacterium]